jgi:small subunit ribosomal protein S4e
MIFMAKRGGTKHMKRLASPKAVLVHDKKDRKWMINTAPGPHPKKHSISLGVLLRDILGVATTAREAKRVLSARMVLVDGKPRTDDKFPVGLMDIVSLPKMELHYRMMVDHKGRLVAAKVGKAESSHKLLKVVGKHTVPGGKHNISFHDGKNLLGDNHVRVGDSVVVSLPEAKLKTHLKREKGSRCLIMEGKHAGSVVKLKDIIERKGGKPNEALVESDGAEFITVAKYLFVVDEGFKVKEAKAG